LRRYVYRLDNALCRVISRTIKVVDFYGVVIPYNVFHLLPISLFKAFMIISECA